MAYSTITKRLKADGTPRYTCRVRVKQNGRIVYNDTRTFSKLAPAKEWGKKRSLEIEQFGFGENFEGDEVITLGKLIYKYLSDPFLELGRTKRKTLEFLIDCDISKRQASKVNAAAIIQHCKERKSTGVTPSTINHDVSYLRSVFKHAKPAWSMNLDDSAFVEALPILKDLNLIGKSERRTRRPTSVEIDKLTKALSKRQSHRGSKIPFIDILNFSILSCMRIGEVCKIRWDDVQEDSKSVLVRDRKDPRKKAGNHMLVPLLGGAWEILQKQPKTADFIFPYESKSVSAGFQRVRNQLGIENLRYHDLRREGASRLFEKGYHIDEVAQVTGHRDLKTLWQVYTELYPNRLHDKDI
ncbi:tyrosine-type recombinase/integrase [Algicola sagamiensis]|uniref:tyrosine-type recombinase/integrase n=1 Tax=Algicola sagamiensis TaxID=163869 RepID=UPI0003740D2A|nr:site-specific integrase [Algicola sagamiensis]